MAIILDVLTRLDERAIQVTGQAVETEFVGVGLRAGEKMITGIHDAFGHFNPAEAIEGFADMSGVEQAGSIIGNRLGAGITAGIKVAMAGGAAAIGLTTIAFEIGEQFEEINRQIELHSNASGEALEGLKQHADALVGSLDTSAKQVGSDMATLAQRLHMEAGGALDQLTHNVEMLRDRFGQLDTSQLAAGMSQFQVSGDQANNTLAGLVEQSREFAVSLPQLIENTASFGTTLHEAGLSMDQAGHFLATLQANGVPAQQAVMGLEASMKAAQKTGQDFPTFVRNLAASLEYYKRTGQTEMAEQVAFDVAGSRRWAQLLAAANAYNETVRAGAGAYQGQQQQLADLEQHTQNFRNLWQELRNHIAAALAPQGASVVDEVGTKMRGLIEFVDAHRDNIRHLFEAGINAASALAEGLLKIADLLGQHPGLIHAVVVAFGTWEAIRGVNAVLTTIEAVTAALRAMPVEAATAEAGVATAASGMSVALGPVVVALTTIAALLAQTGSASTVPGGQFGGQPVGPGAPAPGGGGRTNQQERQERLEAGRAYSQQHGSEVPPGRGYQDWIEGKGPMPPEMAPYYRQPSADQPKPPPNVPGYGASPDAPGALGGLGRPPVPPPPGAPPDAGGGGSPFDGVPDNLLTPQQLEEKKKGGKGPRLPQAPQIPFGPEYSAPPQAGETEQHYSARGNVLEAEHALAEKRARVEQLEKTTTATAEDVTNARNAVAEAERKVNEARGRLSTEEQSERDKELRAIQGHGRRLREAGSEFEQVGAKLDQDLGVSKGLAGIADNLTRFLANLAMAPVYGNLMAQQAAAGGGLGIPRGAGGMIGMAALGGAFGPQYTPEGLIASGSYGQGMLGGYGAGGMGGALGALSGGEALGLGGLGGGLGNLGNTAGLMAGGNRVRALYGLATALQGTPYSMQLRNDCSGMVSELASAALGLPIPSAAERFSTANEGQWLMSHGFVSGPGGKNDLNIGWHVGGPGGGHTAATLPGGVGAEQGGSANQFTLGGMGAANPEFEYHAHLPMVAGGGGGGYGGLGGSPYGGLGGMDPSSIMGGDGASAPAFAPSGFAGSGGAMSPADYIKAKGAALGLTSTEIQAALGVGKLESNWGPVGAMGFGPEAKAVGMNFDNNFDAAVDQFFRQYTSRMPPGLNRNDPQAVASYIWHTVHNAADPNYGSKLLGAMASPGVPGVVPLAGGPAGPGQAYSAATGGAVPTANVTGSGKPGPGGPPVYSTSPHYPQWWKDILDNPDDQVPGWMPPFDLIPNNPWMDPRFRGGMSPGGTGKPSPWEHFQGGGAVPIIAHEGEFVMRREAVDHYGRHAMAAINGRRFDTGGSVGSSVGQNETDLWQTLLGIPLIGGHSVSVMQLPDLFRRPSPPKGGPPMYQDGGQVHQGSGAAPGPTQIGGAEPWAGIGSGIPGSSGATAGAAAGMAAGAASMGIGMAAQIAMQEIQRAIQFAGQAAGIGIQAAEQTFIPTGGSQLAASSWLSRIAGAVVGAKPALPNLAGKAPTPVPGAGQAGGIRMPLTPEAILGPAAASAAGGPSGPGPLPGPAARPQHLGTGAPPGPGNYTGVHIENFHAGERTDASVANEIARHDVNKYNVTPLTGQR